MRNKISNYLLPNDGKWHLDSLSGLTVALALIPEAVAFALVAQVDPLIGLYAAFFMCIITALFGGRPGMISGATGSMAVVIVALVVQHPGQYGLELLFATIILTGIIQILAGVAGWGKFIRMMPKSVMVGFVNGLAIVIFLAQMEQFKFHSGGHLEWLSGTKLYMMIGLVIIAMAITHYLPKFTKKIPSALTAILAVSAIVYIGGFAVTTVADMMTSDISGTPLPHLAIPHITLSIKTLLIILPYAVILAIVGLSESLLTLSLIDEKTKTRGFGNRECIAQGAGNVTCGFFGTMGGCAMIGQSMINITSGGRGRLSGIVAGLFLLTFILVLWDFIKLIPLAALVGVMMMVVYETFEWATFSFIKKIPLKDALIIIVVTIVTVATNLAVAVVVGVILASLIFAWETAKNIYAEISYEGKTKKYLIHGPVFFGSTTKFKELFDVENDPVDIIIDFKHSRVSDQSAIDILKDISEEYLALHKKLHLIHLNNECKKLLGKAGALVEINILEDEQYNVATDKI